MSGLLLIVREFREWGKKEMAAFFFGGGGAGLNDFIYFFPPVDCEGVARIGDLARTRIRSSIIVTHLTASRLIAHSLSESFLFLTCCTSSW